MSSEPTVLSHAKALTSGLLADLGPGAYRVEYHDSTHMPEGEFRPLLALEVRDGPLTSGPWGRDGYPFYTIAPAAPPVGVTTPPSLVQPARPAKGAPMPEAAKAQADKAKELAAAKELDKLRDILGQSLVRVGILPARAEREAQKDLHELSRGRGLILIPDTNSLANGVLHFLLRALSSTQVWLLPVAVSLTTIQNHDAKLKSLVNTAKPGNLQNALRSRSLVNATLALLERCRAHVQVLEVDPQLLRYMRPASDKGADPDQGDVLEDRLLLETIHASLGAMRTQAARRVVTADVFLSRILRAEGVQTLALQPRRLPDEPTPCLRYDPIARAFVGATPVELLWDLAHTFSSVRLVDPRHPDEPLMILDAYWDGKTARDWQSERLRVRRAARPPGGGVLSTAVLPDVPFRTVLDLAGALLKGPGSLDALLARIPDARRPSEQVARNAAEVLVRADFASQGDLGLSPNEGLVAMDEALAAGDLDAVSGQWEHAYGPYGALVGALRERCELAFDELSELLERSLGSKPAKRACNMLMGMTVLLGQAWLAGRGLFDGTVRPRDEEAVEAVRGILAKRARDGLLSVAVLLPAVCKALRMSPWAAAEMFQRLQQSSALPEVTFSASLPPQESAPEPVQVVRGPLSDLSTEEIPLDRLRFGDSLIYTVSWSPR